LFFKTNNTRYLLCCLTVNILFYSNEVVQTWLEKAFQENVRNIYRSELSFFNKALSKIGLSSTKMKIGYSADLIWFAVFLGATTGFIAFMLLFFLVTQGVLLSLTLYKIIKIFGQAK
jgi:hypothetical protein